MSDVTRKQKRRTFKRPLCALILTVLLSGNAEAINLGLPEHRASDYPWGNEWACQHPLDAPVKEAYPPSGKFFLTLGPTGIRARINEDAPTHLLVTFVFQDAKSPAKGLIKKDDVIIGAGGKTFNKPHVFGRRGGAKGWDGPLMDLAGAIEDAQGSDGMLSLMVWPEGSKNKQATVAIQLEKKGKFAPTYPWNCPRSEKMLAELCDFMAAEIEAGRSGQVHSHSHMILALMASGIKKHDSVWNQAATKIAKGSYTPDDGGFCTWGWGFSGIILGEYYHLCKDKAVIPAIKQLNTCYRAGMHGDSGSYSHRSSVSLRKSGGKPYASMAGISGLAMTAMSLFKANGLEYNEEAYFIIHRAYLNSGTENNAAIAYGFGGLGTAGSMGLSVNATLAVPSKGISPDGEGGRIKGGVDSIGKYEIVYPGPQFLGGHAWIWSQHVKDAEAVGKKPFYWVTEEKARNIVTQGKDGSVVISRVVSGIPEPTKPYNTTGESMHPLPTGTGAPAHMIDAMAGGPKSWEYYGKHCANTCANSYEHIDSGHGGGQLHAFWTVVGASWADKDKQRKFLDYVKSFLILSETHQGGMIVQPWNRDRPGGNGDPFYGSRSLPTATAAMLLSLPKKRLMIIGAGDGQPSVASSGSSYGSSSSGSAAAPVSSPAVAKRKARELSDGSLESLDKALLGTLVKLSESKALKPLPLQLSVSRAQVVLLEVKNDGELTFLASTKSKAELQFDKLAAVDRTTLALLVASLKADSSDAQAMAGVYQESIGRVDEADQFYKKAGDASVNKLTKLFNK